MQVGYYSAGDRMKYWGKSGGVWCGFWRLLLGSAWFVIPAIGPVPVAGPLVTWIVRDLERGPAVGGLSAAGAGLFSLGIPKHNVVRYGLALKTGKYLLLVHSCAPEVEKARQIIGMIRPVDVMVRSAEALVMAARQPAKAEAGPWPVRLKDPSERCQACASWR